MTSEKIIILTSKIKSILGVNYVEESDEILENLIREIAPIASNASNRLEDDEKLFPYISQAVRAEYLARGAEGLSSRSEGSMSSSFNNIIEEMRLNIVKNGVRRLK